jgi:hypothetical protein
MGREIRRVPPDWEHPKRERCEHHPKCDPVCDQPLYDEDYDEAAQEWMREFAEWEADKDGVRTEASTSTYFTRYFWDWHGSPPDKDYYRSRKWTTAEATNYQIYETVSEGTPVTPHFATKEELIDYLVEHGDLWDQQRGAGGWTRENAESFVSRGYAVSLTVNRTATSVTIKEPRDGQ